MEQKYNKICWRIGQEITPDTFIHADNYICSQHNLIRRLIAGKYHGLLPLGEADFIAKATLNNRDFHLEQLSCYGTTEAGYLVSFNNSLLASLPKNRLSIPDSEADVFYVVLHINPFEQVLIEPVNNEETPEAHLVYELTIKELNQIETDELAIIKINNSSHTPMIDNDYIPPCMSVNACTQIHNVFNSAKTLFAEIRSIIVNKDYQFEKLMYPLTLLHHELDEFSEYESPIALVKFIKKIMITCQFFIPDIQKVVRPALLGEYCHNDVAIIFKSLLSCLHEIKMIVGKVEEEDFTPQI